MVNGGWAGGNKQEIFKTCEDDFNNCQQSAEMWILTSVFGNVFGQINL